MSAEFLQGLIRRLYSEPRITAAYLGGDLANAATGLDEIDLYLLADPSFRAALATWLEPLGHLAYSGAEPNGWRTVTPDGVEWRFRFRLPASTAGLERLFDRRGQAQVPAVEAEPAIDLPAMAGRFWSDLHRAARAIGKGHPLTAHGRLEECRRAMLNLYRLALAPRTAGEGWEGAEALPGVVTALAPVQEWLVAPLDLRQQWRSAHRLASTYESLMLPLCDRLGVPYPMAMRKLAFDRLEQSRPDRGAEAAPPQPPEPPTPAPAPSGRMRVAKGSIRRP